jgi:hypothetical protein
VSEITRLFVSDRDDILGLRRLLAVDVLPDDWRPTFERLLRDAA